LIRASAALLFVVFAVHASADAIDDLAGAIEARLLLMPDVARHKWNHGLPVADPEREAALLEQIALRAVVLSIDPPCARAALEAQLAASRAWQSQLVERWRARARGPFKDVPDLATALRPAIDASTDRLLDALRDVGCSADATTSARLSAPPPALSDRPRVWAIAVAPWIAP
jgi:chorismate mutase